MKARVWLLSAVALVAASFGGGRVSADEPAAKPGGPYLVIVGAGASQSIRP